MTYAGEDPEHDSPVEVRTGDDGILLITLNRPDARNAVDRVMSQTLSDAFALLDEVPELRVAVLSATGPAFCAGMDLKAFARGESVTVQPRGFAGIATQPPAKPVVVAVEGVALGGGFEIVLACDIVVASTAATFGLPEVTRGLTANAGGLLRLPRQIPHHHALELVLTGERMSAERAARLGLINHLTEPGKALGEALRIAARIAVNAPLAVAASKRVMTESAGWAPADAFSRQEEIVGPIRRSSDAAEGARAFAEKRPPTWTGR